MLEIYSVDEVVLSDTSVAVIPPHQLSPSIRKTLTVGALCNDAILKEDGSYVGHATDVALLNVLKVFDMSDPRQVRRPYAYMTQRIELILLQDFTRRFEVPFSSERKYMTVSGVHGASTVTNANREMYYIKGSIDAILDRCKFYYVSDDSTPALDANMRTVISTRAQATASRGLRVIAIAYAVGNHTSSGTSTPAGRVSVSVASNADSDRPRSNLVFLGFEAMSDPPRKGVADTIALLQNGGVQVVMITGDAEETALSIARALGLRVGARDGGACLTGQAIDRMTKGQLMERVGAVSVFARTTPKHKMAIVEAFQARGAVVAMTGDGGT